MEYKYMVVAFLDKVQEGQVLTPPKHPHVTVKKKFKLIDIDEPQLVSILRGANELPQELEVRLGESKEYDSPDNMVIEVLNPESWTRLHKYLVDLLGEHIESRDPHFEGDNYLPHVTWKLQGEDMWDPKRLENTSHKISKLHLIERVDPAKSVARVVTVIDLGI